MFVTILIGYVFLSLLATVVVISACIVGGRADRSIENAMSDRKSKTAEKVTTVEHGTAHLSQEGLAIARVRLPNLFSPAAK